MGKNKRGPKKNTGTASQAGTSTGTSTSKADSNQPVNSQFSNATNSQPCSSSNANSAIPTIEVANKKSQTSGKLSTRSQVEAKITPFLESLDHNSKLYPEYTTLSGVVLDRCMGGNINLRSPVPIVGRMAAAEMVAKMEKLKPPPANPQQQQPSKKKEKVMMNSDELLLDNLGPDSTKEQKLSMLIQSANLSLNKAKDLKSYDPAKTSDPTYESKKKLKTLSKFESSSACSKQATKAVTHCEGGHEIVCRQCTEIQPPELASLIKYNSSSFDMFKVFQCKKEQESQTCESESPKKNTKDTPSSSTNSPKPSTSSSKSPGAATSSSGESEVSKAVENFLSLNPENYQHSTELMLDSALQYLQLERLKVARQFVSCAEKRKKILKTCDRIDKRNETDQKSTVEEELQPETGLEIEQGSEESGKTDIHAELFQLTLDEAKKPQDPEKLKEANKRTVRFLCEKLYNRPTCICKEPYFSKLGSEVTPCDPNRRKPCVCRLIYSSKCAKCGSCKHKQAKAKQKQLREESNAQSSESQTNVNDCAKSSNCESGSQINANEAELSAEKATKNNETPNKTDKIAEKRESDCGSNRKQPEQQKTPNKLTRKTLDDEPVIERDQLLSETSLHYLRYKVKTVCEVFPNKTVEEVLDDREFQLISKKWANEICMDEYMKEESRIRREKRDKARQWAVKKADIEAKIDKCLHVMEWARENEEFMLDHATDDEREFLASVLIRGNGLIKQARELSNDKESIELIAKPTSKPTVQASEVDLIKVEDRAQRKFQLELPKLIQLFEKKHILSYFSLW